MHSVYPLPLPQRGTFLLKEKSLGGGAFEILTANEGEVLANSSGGFHFC